MRIRNEVQNGSTTSHHEHALHAPRRARDARRRPGSRSASRIAVETAATSRLLQIGQAIDRIGDEHAVVVERQRGDEVLHAPPSRRPDRAAARRAAARSASICDRLILSTIRNGSRKNASSQAYGARTAARSVRGARGCPASLIASAPRRRRPTTTARRGRRHEPCAARGARRFMAATFTSSPSSSRDLVERERAADSRRRRRHRRRRCRHCWRAPRARA